MNKFHYIASLQAPLTKVRIETINFRLLRTLVILHETRSTSTTADRVARTQSAISHQMRKLEELLAVQILIHKKGSIIFTPAGEKVSEIARQVLAEAEDAFNHSSPCRSNEGEFVVGVTEDLFPEFLSKLDGSVQNRAVFQVDCSGSLWRKFRSGVIDVALIKSEKPLPDAVASWSVRLAWYKYRHTTLDLSQIDLRLLSPECAYHLIALRVLKDGNYPFRVCTISPGWLAIAETLKWGGVTIASSSLGNDFTIAEELPSLPSAFINLLINNRHYDGSTDIEQTDTINSLLTLFEPSPQQKPAQGKAASH